MQTYDVIVIGTGGVGSAALYHLAKRGVKVLGLDRFPLGHDRGSSHGRTRIIRQAYFEHPDYVPLLLRAYELWEELSQRCGKQLYHEIGLLQVSEPGGVVVPGVLESAHKHGLLIDELSAAEAMERFPGFRFPQLWKAVFERRAGYLDVEDCVLEHLVEARKAGAELQTGVIVNRWCAEGSGVVVETDHGQFTAGKLVISSGPWANSFLSDLGISLRVLRKDVFWFPIRNNNLRADDGCPAFLFEYGAGIFYGIPEIDDWGLKIARHSGGEEISDPLQVDRDPRPSTVDAMDLTVKAILPQVGRPHSFHNTCLYTMSPDENFIVDVHPQYPQVSFAAGLSGHGFKFTCVLGEILADLALDGRTAHPISFLNCRRFGTL